MCFISLLFQRISFFLACVKKATLPLHNMAKMGCFITLLMIGACTILVPEQSQALKNAPGFTVKHLSADSFTLYTAQKVAEPGQDLVVYIEGDGRAWVTRRQLSTDPTPLRPVVQDWAKRDPRPNVAYLARPCQFVGAFETPCEPAYWSNKRFAPDVIASMNDAVTQLKANARATHITLIGYSGGGAVAALIAARRDDVTSLITVAGNLDPQRHAMLHHVSSLDGSLNPRDIAPQLGHLKQRHFIGEFDKNVPSTVVESFTTQLPLTTDVRLIMVPGATHDSGWDKLDFAADAF